MKIQVLWDNMLWWVVSRHFCAMYRLFLQHLVVLCYIHEDFNL